MSTKFIMLACVTRVEEKIARQWVSGAGDKAVFDDRSEGWYAVLDRSPASIYLGTGKPGLKEGDTVRLTLEKV